MKKILLITNAVPFYRKELYELLADKYIMTIAHFGTYSESKKFNEINIKVINKYGLIISKTKINYEEYDVVIVWSSLRFSELYKHALKAKRNYKIIMMGPGVSSSYTKLYDESNIVFKISKYLLKKYDAAIFYDNYPLIRYSSKGIEPNKLYAAYNTVTVNKKSDKRVKRKHRKHFVFIGTLYKEKGLKTLIDAYKIINEEANILLPKLYIIGDGPEKNIIKKYIKEYKLENIIEILGRINEDKKLEPVLNKSIASISPHQAGLSVLKSFAYGVPFITTKYPVTGGEFTAIQDNVTGYIYDGTVGGLAKTLKNIIKNKENDTIINNCYDIYEKHRSPKEWINQVSKAIEYVSCINNESTSD